MRIFFDNFQNQWRVSVSYTGLIPTRALWFKVRNWNWPFDLVMMYALLIFDRAAWHPYLLLVLAKCRGGGGYGGSTLTPWAMLSGNRLLGGRPAGIQCMLGGRPHVSTPLQVSWSSPIWRNVSKHEVCLCFVFEFDNNKRSLVQSTESELINFVSFWFILCRFLTEPLGTHFPSWCLPKAVVEGGMGT